MKKIGMFYGTETKKTNIIAQKIQQSFTGNTIDIIPVEAANKEDFEAYDIIIVGTSTWFDGELPDYIDEIMPELSTIDFSHKKVAIFGLGDQKRYPDNFADGVGIVAETLENCGATIIGKTSPEDYKFNQSKALKEGQFQGLVIDVENQTDRTEKRIKDWVNQLKKEFK